MLLTVHGKYLVGENFGKQHTGKAIGEEKFGELATVSLYVKYIFGVSVNIGKEKFLMIHQIHQFFPTKNFPCMVVPSWF